MGGVNGVAPGSFLRPPPRLPPAGPTQPRARVVLAVLLAVLLAGAGLAVVRRSADAAAATRLAVARDTVVVSRDGRSRPAVAGEQVADGVVVRTGAGGAADLVTAGRVVRLGGGSAYRVDDGVRGVLQRGAAYLDLRRGPPLRLTLDRLAVRVPAGALARVERGIADRVVAYTGTVRAEVSAGRGVDVRPLHQELVSASVLPASTGPLRLVPDGWDRAAVPDVVRLDQRIRELAVGLDAMPVAVEAVAALPADVLAGLPAEAGEPASGPLLAVALARAARATRPGLAVEVRQLRAAGGSWGVVARLVGADGDRIGAALSALLTPAVASLAAGPPLTVVPPVNAAPVSQPGGPAGVATTSPGSMPSGSLPSGSLPSGSLPSGPALPLAPAPPAALTLPVMPNPKAPLPTVTSVLPLPKPSSVPGPVPVPVLPVPVLPAPALPIPALPMPALPMPSSLPLPAPLRTLVPLVPRPTSLPLPASLPTRSGLIPSSALTP